jgi:hypothetical protein
MTERAKSNRRRSGGWLLASVLACAGLAAVFALRDGEAPRIAETRAETPKKPPARDEVHGERVQERASPLSGEVLAATRSAEVPSSALEQALAAASSAAPPARTFATPAEEIAFLRERLPGERLTLKNRARSLDGLRQLLAKSDVPERGELERRARILEAKHDAQEKRVQRSEQRLAELGEAELENRVMP